MLQQPQEQVSHELEAAANFRESTRHWGTQSDSYKKLSELLGLAVPLWVIRLLERGGPTSEDVKRVAGYDDELGRADVLLFGSKKQGELASFFNKLAETLAVLSFCPGGIELFDLRYESLPLLAAYQQRAQQQVAEVAEKKEEEEQLQ